jgi:adenosine deaminase
MNGLHSRFAPDTAFYPELALGDKQDKDAGQSRIDEIFASDWFKGIDICNYSNLYTLQELKSICRKAHDSGLILKAHIGEFGKSDDVMRYAEELELDEIQHGILWRIHHK